MESGGLNDYGVGDHVARTQLRPRPTCIAISLGRVDYLRGWELQKSVHRQVVDGILPHVLLLLEHPHVYTLGRRGKPSDILATPEWLSQNRVDVHHVDRGGEATYHGPGQLVAYPVVDLRSWGVGPTLYVRTLEAVLIATLAELGIEAESEGHPTGVWVGDAKIAAIGVKVSRGVTTHGFALNVDPDLSFFDHIVPCGMPGIDVTSMASERPGSIAVKTVMPVVARHFASAFDLAVEWRAPESLGLLAQPVSPVA